MSIVPAKRPELNRESVEQFLRDKGVGLTKPALVGRRGYYRDTMGRPGVNDLGIYDDAMFFVSPTNFASFNANVDPSRHRPGMASLAPGLWKYKIGIHNISKDPALHPRYTALVQAAEVTVHRDGDGNDTGWFGINIHKGSYTGTSSEGCQTIHPEQWNGFIVLVQDEMKDHGVATIPYLLTEYAP
jgi:lysozyme